MKNHTAEQPSSQQTQCSGAQWIEVSNKNSVHQHRCMYVLSLSPRFAAFTGVAVILLGRCMATMHVNARNFYWDSQRESPSIFCICTYKWPCWRARGIYNAIPWLKKWRQKTANNQTPKLKCLNAKCGVYTLTGKERTSERASEYNRTC